MDAARRPAMLAMELLEAVADSHYTTELGLFNLEINLDPLAFGGDCLSRLGEPARIRPGPFESRSRTNAAPRWCWWGSCRPCASPTLPWPT